MIYKAPNRKTLALANIIHKTENTPTEVLSSRCRLCQTKQINDDTLIQISSCAQICDDQSGYQQIQIDLYRFAWNVLQSFLQTLDLDLNQLTSNPCCGFVQHVNHCTKEPVVNSRFIPGIIQWGQSHFIDYTFNKFTKLSNVSFLTFCACKSCIRCIPVSCCLHTEVLKYAFPMDNRIKCSSQLPISNRKKDIVFILNQIMCG